MGVLFDDTLDLQIQKPAQLTVNGNFETVKQQLTALVSTSADFIVTEDNIAQAKSMQRYLAHLRLSIDKQRKDWKNLYIKTPEKLLDIACSELQDIIAQGENNLKQQLDAFDQRRVDELTEIFQTYIDDAVKRLGITEQFRNLIVIKKQYYNKTASEAATVDDIEEQAQVALKKQQEFAVSVDLLGKEIAGTSLNLATYTDMLQYKSFAEVLALVKRDKEYIKQQTEKQQTESQPDNQPVADSQPESKTESQPAADSQQTENGNKSLTLVFEYDSRDKDVFNKAYKEFIATLRSNCKYAYSVATKSCRLSK
jgi:hypothetical protein